jgi:hypothetical protein
MTPLGLKPGDPLPVPDPKAPVIFERYDEMVRFYLTLITLISFQIFTDPSEQLMQRYEVWQQKQQQNVKPQLPIQIIHNGTAF